jgi:hypothetical protein
MQIFKIKNRFNGKIICEFKAKKFIYALEKAVNHNIDLQDANLAKVALQRADLRGANLQGTNLQGANLKKAMLIDAYIDAAFLVKANLQEADLEEANLKWADLRGANFQGANLKGADLRETDLRKANLKGANLEGADFEGANLEGANLQRTNIYKTNFNMVSFKNTKLPKFQIPQTKSLIVYKKLKDNAIATLRIPSRTRRTACLVNNIYKNQGKFGKCRAERAFVVAIENWQGKPAKKGRSYYNNNFIYEVGKEVKPEYQYNPDILIECTSGIHFFMSKKEAKEYRS